MRKDESILVKLTTLNELHLYKCQWLSFAEVLYFCEYGQINFELLLRMSVIGLRIFVQFRLLRCLSPKIVRFNAADFANIVLT